MLFPPFLSLTLLFRKHKNLAVIKDVFFILLNPMNSAQMCSGFVLFGWPVGSLVGILTLTSAALTLGGPVLHWQLKCVHLQLDSNQKVLNHLQLHLSGIQILSKYHTNTLFPAHF